ncbi:MAG TPA: hypothetical protein VFK69_11515 [Candidatus Eisenbacteria bacterium]|nr:hypothetical protein [Candidatus Eisenbacteria bacterium]
MRWSRFAAALVMLAATAFAVSPAHAALGGPVNPSLFQELRWRLVGPFRGGRVLAVSGVPGEPRHFYFGAVNGGVWETTNAGRTWKPIFDGVGIGSIGALAVAPSNGRILYVGTGEADMRSDIAQGNGVFKSLDGGKTWRFVGLGDTQQIGRIVVDPRNADVVYVAALGHPYGPNAERGVFKSRDGGAHWSRVLGPDANTGAIDLALEPGHPDVIYAALWQTRRTPWNIYPPSNGPGSGLYRSNDGGARWTHLTGSGFPAAPARIGIAVAPSAPARVYALVDAEDGGLYRSDDRGAHWARASSDTRIWQRGWYFAGVTVEPKDADVVYVCNTNLFRSGDGGRSFAPIEGDATGDDFHTLWIDPRDPERRILGTDQGTIVSTDGGRSWSSWYNQPTAQIYHVSTDDRFPYWVYGPQQDAGAVGMPSRTNTFDGITLEQFREVTVGGESHNMLPDPLDPQVIYGGTVDKLDLRTEQTRAVDPTAAYPDQWRGTWTLPLAFSHRDPHVLYFARQKVFRTADGGEHWTTISPDLTREAPGVPATLDPASASHDLGLGPRRGVVYALAPSYLAARELWAATDDGLVWRTRDEGAHWQNVTPAALTPWSKVGIVEPSHFDGQTAYIAVDRHRLDDRRPYIYRTHDGGRSWQLVTAGIPADQFVNAVREDPKRRGLLYAATEQGVQVSFDDGDHWQSLQLGLPVTSVRDLVVKGDDLVIATHGRGIWILDDVTPLRQLDREVADAPAWLFQPAKGYRVRPAGFTGTPMPKDEPMAPNPPAGAAIDYALAAAARQPVTLEIRDAAGQLVRRYSSADSIAVQDPAHMRTAPQWIVPEPHLAATPGMHRFVWSLQYAPVEVTPGGRPRRGGDGAWAPPGDYAVTLTVNGTALHRTLSLAPDPRVKLDAADYRAEFELARRVETISARLAKASTAAGAMRKALTDRSRHASGALVDALDQFSARLTELSGDTPVANPANAFAFPPKHIESLRWLTDALGNLHQMVDGADAAPSPDTRVACDKLQAMTDASLVSWQRFATRDLDALNRRLQDGGLAPIAPGP